MQPQPRALSLAIGAALAIAFSIPAHALVITQTSAQRTDQNLTAVDSTLGGVPVVSGPSTATFGSYAQFNPDDGVLTAVTLNLGVTGSFRQTNSTGNVGGNTTLDAAWSYFGQSSTHQLAARSSAGTTTVSTNISTSLAPSANFIGSGSVAGSSSASYTVSANKTTQNGNGSPTITATYNRPGTENPTLSNNAVQTLTYTYLLHAAPSFDADSNLMALTLDFGDVALNTTSFIDFSIFNRGIATDQVGLDFSIDDILASGNTAEFTTDLESFSRLEAGAGNDYKARFAATTLGATEAIYRLTFGDDATVGLAANRYRYSLDLRLIGRVVGEPPVNGVPEPGVLVLLGIGLLGIGLQRKRA